MMFSEIYSTKEKPNLKVLLIKKIPSAEKILLSMPLNQVFDRIDNLRQLCIIAS